MKQLNLTEGKLPRELVAFSLPFLLSYFLQTLYGMADLFIIGRFNGTAVTTAVSVGSQVMHMVTVMIVGLAMGTAVLIGRAEGKGDRIQTCRIIGNTAVLFGTLSVLTAVVLLLCRRGIVRLLTVPAEAAEDAVRYLTVCFLGIPFITAYNVLSSVFRGLGDSRSPLSFVAVACAVNVGLDYLFIGALGMGAAGAALGTVLSQLLSVIFALASAFGKESTLKPKKQDFRPDRPLLRDLVRTGIPVACQDGFIQISFLTITVIANMRGLTDAAAVGIVEKCISFIFLVPSTLLATVSAAAAQNFGAEKSDRARETLRWAVLAGILYGLLAGTVLQFTAEGAVRLFSSDPAVIVSGGQYFRSYVWDALFAGIHFSCSGYFCACKRSGLSFLHNILSILCVRIPLAWLLSSHFPDTLFPMGFASTLGSVFSVIICLFALRWLRKKHLAQ